MNIATDYKPAFWLRNGHVQTILPTLFRKVSGVNYIRERISTFDDDFLDLDWSGTGGTKLAVLSHGLEGGTDRCYIKGMVKTLNKHNIDSLAWNYRGCSGVPNRQFRMYHNGCTDDLDLIIRHAISREYENIVLMGFSMGGNLSLLYLGQEGECIPSQVKGAVTFSVPIDLADTASQLSRKINTIYMKRFLKLLHEKIKAKIKRFPDRIDDKGYAEIKDFKAFDDRYTAPMHGFKDAEDYWTKCSSMPALENIQIPSLIINAKDDPFLGPACYNLKHISNPHIIFEMTEYGGHVGFMEKRIHGNYWSETRAVQFIDQLFQE